MIEKLKAMFVDECTHFWRLWSNQFAFVAGSAISWMVENNSVVLPYISTLPSPWKGVVTAFLTIFLPIALRMVKQPKLPRRSA